MNGEEQMNQFPIADNANKSSKGPVLGIIIIILLIILGGFYVLTSRKQPPQNGLPPTDSPAGRTGDLDAAATPDLTDLEAEAQNLDSDLQNLDQEITAQ